jgi:meromycolic acid enoyl-[acyl-carrier-protein] reductase
MLLQGKKLVITGVLTPQSIAYGIAERAREQGAELVLTGFGRAKSLTERSAKRLGPGVDVLELDVTKPEHFKALTESLRQKWGQVDGALHAVAYAPEDALGGNFLHTPFESVQTAFHVSVFSLKELAVALMPLMPRGSALVTLDFDNSSTAWPIYDWMGVCKAALEATVRYLARDLGPKGIRVNTLAAGPLATIAAKGIPGFQILEHGWIRQAPLGWDARKGHDVVSRTACVMLSDWFPATTGELLRVDGGYHAMGAPLADAAERLAAAGKAPAGGTE